MLKVIFTTGEHKRDTVENIQVGDKIVSITPLKKGKKTRKSNQTNLEKDVNVLISVFYL